MPLKVHDLVGTLEMIVQAQARRKKKLRQQPKQRNEKERAVIDQAKALLNGAQQHDGGGSTPVHTEM